MRYKKDLSRHSTATRIRKKKEKAVLLRKILEESHRDWRDETQNWSCFVSNFTNPINKTFIASIYLKNSTFLSLKKMVYTNSCHE